MPPRKVAQEETKVEETKKGRKTSKSAQRSDSKGKSQYQGKTKSVERSNSKAKSKSQEKKVTNKSKVVEETKENKGRYSAIFCITNYVVDKKDATKLAKDLGPLPKKPSQPYAIFVTEFSADGDNKGPDMMKKAGEAWA